MRSAPGGSGAVCSAVVLSWVRPSVSSGPRRAPEQRSKRTWIFSEVPVLVGEEPPQPGHQSASPSGSTIVEASSNSTAVNRSSRGMATVSARTSIATAAESSRSRKPAAAEVQRWSSPCGVMRTPARAAAAANCGNEAAGLASQPNTSAWAKSAPVSFEARSTKPVRRPRASAVVVNRVCNRSANGATVVMRRLPSLAKVCYILSMPRVPSLCLLSLMRMGMRARHPHAPPRRGGGHADGEIEQTSNFLSRQMIRLQCETRGVRAASSLAWCRRGGRQWQLRICGAAA